MPADIERRAFRGAKELVKEAQDVLANRGQDDPVAFADSAYYLPITLGITGQPVARMRDVPSAIAEAKRHPGPADSRSSKTAEPDKLLAAGRAALIAGEVLEAVRLGDATVSDNPNVPIQDAWLRSWGMDLASQRMPGFAVIMGSATTSATAALISGELRRNNILCFLIGGGGSKGIITQLEQEGMQLGYASRMVPLGTEAVAAVHAIGFIARLAISIGDLKPGMTGEVTEFVERRLPGFVLALGGLDDRTCAIAAGALSFGLPLITSMGSAPIPNDTKAAEVMYLPFESLGGSDAERAENLVHKCFELRGIRWKDAPDGLPVAYGPGFMDEIVSDADLRLEFGGGSSRAFELLQAADPEDLLDGKIEVLGSEISDGGLVDAESFGLVVQVSGPPMQPGFEGPMERQIASFISEANGVQQSGHRDNVRIRLSKTAVENGFSLRALGVILHNRLHKEFGGVIDKVQVTLSTDPKTNREWLKRAREAYARRDQQAMVLTDTDAGEFYACTRCQCVQPTHLCMVSPERAGACGTYDWLELKATHQIDPAGPSRAVKTGAPIDRVAGTWEGVNAYLGDHTKKAVTEVALYSLMNHPMTSCGFAECVVMLIPEANGVMIVSREDSSATPAGLNFEALAEIAGNGRQTPGVMGVAKSYLISPKFISGDGGFRRVVWMSSNLKEQMRDELKGVCAREGDPQLLDRIADGREVRSVDQLVTWLRIHEHPATQMERIFS